ncbi:rubredoxin [Geothermobacter hydrogeniphilus]|uniref:Rubredoxin n=1 Tax=Geothermobacter hydrogeniphilus TaxID=1969733 RepID=A0A1X0YAH7_9BACT|nr:rubredoxin [Geothermobacter hydrogeniphilus]ORJ62099.1 rubredoxin [Geothermobacter hydrogeniphilus]
MRYICSNCGYIYDPQQGDPMSDIPAGSSFDELPKDWCCPLCYLGKEIFDPLD